jgi:hypothetical protein
MAYSLGDPDRSRRQVRTPDPSWFERNCSEAARGREWQSEVLPADALAAAR